MPDERIDSIQSKPGDATLTLAEGQRYFRHFMLKRFLGRGPLGVAWLAHHEGMGRDLTVRFLPEPWLYDERILGALRGAVVRLLEFTHANLVRVFDFVREERAAAIVTEFVDGEPLQEAKVRQPLRCFEVDDLRPWVAQICEVLDYTHRYHEAVHGDLSPGCLLLTKRGEIKVADFGLVRSLYEAVEQDDTGSVAGTLAYISPERARGLPCSVGDDIYGFGATLYDLLTSRPPFFRGNIFLQLEQAVPPSMAERRAEFGIAGAPLPAEWEEVVAACLAKRPEDRPQSIEEIGVRLGIMERHTPRPAPPPPRVTGPTIVYPSSMPTMGAPAVTVEEVTVRAPKPAPVEIHAGAKIFGRYLLQRELGRGVASTVWLAHDEVQQCPVAVKLLPDLLAHDQEAMDDLALEARRAGALNHPHIVRLFDFALGAEGAAIVMEYVDGEALTTVLKRRGGGCFQAREIESWVRDLAAGLGHAHEVGLVHRDVQPGNLLINDAGMLQLTGFGTARSVSDSMTRVSMSGSNLTLAYLSPEQALGESPSAADDIYAFGATVYELLTGRPPFYSGNLLHQLGTTVPPPMGTRRAELGGNGEPIPAVWEEVVAACLAKRAQDRPKTMKDITDQLSAPESSGAPAAAPEGEELRAAIRKIISTGEPEPACPAAGVLAPEELRSVIRKMVGSTLAESPQTVLGHEELRSIIRKMVGPATPATPAEPASGALGQDELRSVVRKMIAEQPSEETDAAPHVTLQPEELRQVIRKMVAAGAPAEDAPTPLSMPAEELRQVIRKMIGTGAPEAAAPATGALGPDELRSVIRQMVGTPPAEQPAAQQVLGPEELRGVIRKMVGVEPAAANPAALAPEELRSIVRKMVGDAVPAAPAPPAEQPLGAAELRAVIAKMVPGAPPVEERTMPAVPPKAPEPSANDSSAEVTLRAVPAKPAPPSDEGDFEKTMPGAKAPPPLPAAKPVPEPTPSDAERTMPAAPPPLPPPPPPKAAPPPVPSGLEKTMPAPPKEIAPPPMTEPVRAAGAPPPARPPAAPPPPPAVPATPPPKPAAANPPPPVPPPAPTIISAPVSPAAVPPVPSSSPVQKSSLPIGALIGGGLLLVVLAIGGVMMMKGGKHASSGETPVIPVGETPVVADATPPPVNHPPDNPPPVNPPPVIPPPAGGGTVTVSQLADLAGKGAVREVVYLVGEFKTTSAQGTSAVLRPTAEANGALAGQVRIDALYPENAVLPAEGSHVTLTAAMRCRVLGVRRGADKQINVDARMEK